MELAGAALNGPLDVVGGHVGRLGGRYGRAQTRVAVGVAAALAGRHRDLSDDLGEDLAALGVGPSLFVFDGAPLAVAGHGASSELGPIRRVPGVGAGIIAPGALVDGGRIRNTPFERGRRRAPRLTLTPSQIMRFGLFVPREKLRADS